MTTRNNQSFYEQGQANKPSEENFPIANVTIFDTIRVAITEMMSEEHLTELLQNVQKFTPDGLMTMDGLRTYTMHFTMHNTSYNQLTELSSKLVTYLLLERMYDRVITALVQVFKKQDENLVISIQEENALAKLTDNEIINILINNKELLTLLIVLLTIVI